MDSPILYIAIPCYNEQEVLLETSRRLAEKLASLMNQGMISQDSRVMFVNVGSKDSTWQIIRTLHEKNLLFSGIDLTKNRGHQYALLAGLLTAKDRMDVEVSMAADLNDDIDAKMEKYYGGWTSSTAFSHPRRRTLLQAFHSGHFYRIIDLMGAETVFNHADYRLMSKMALGWQVLSMAWAIGGAQHH